MHRVLHISKQNMVHNLDKNNQFFEYKDALATISKRLSTIEETLAKHNEYTYKFHEIENLINERCNNNSQQTIEVERYLMNHVQSVKHHDAKFRNIELQLK